MANRIVSWSELGTGRQCPHKHDLAYKQRWTTPRDETTAAGRGTLWHKIMDTHYTSLKNGEHPGDPVDTWFKEMRRVGKDSDTLELLRWMYEGYVEKWGFDDEWEILAVEYRTQVPLKTAAGRRSGFVLKMILDLVVRNRRTRRIWIVDHKSHANIPKDKELELDDQFGLYTWGLRELGKNPFGCVYNTARTQRNKGDDPAHVLDWERKKAAGTTKAVRPVGQSLDQRFDRYLMARTDVELDTIAQEALDTARYLYSKANKGERYTNPDTCKWKCDFTEACLLGRKTSAEREQQFLRDVGFKPDFTRH